MITPSPRGFTLLIALIVTSVLVSIGLALIDVAYKQVLLASTAKNSQIAFYNADSALECGLFYDQRFNAFSPNSVATSSIRCAGQNVTVAQSGTPTQRTSIFSIPCSPSNSAQVTVIKNTSGETAIYANGYSSCIAADARRVERGLKIIYSTI